ncbi:MAG: lactate utilization protein C [Paludibacteraceae bacterium]
MSSSKDKILEKIRETKLARKGGQVLSVSKDKEIYKAVLPNTVTCFKTELESINGKCEIFNTEKETFLYLRKIVVEKDITPVFCKEEDIVKLLNQYEISSTNAVKDFESMKGAVTSCELLVARTGSVVVTSASKSGRQLISFPPVHIVVANTSQLVDYLEDAYTKIIDKFGENLPSQITTITGPSRTADIEKTLVLGAHGPKELIVLLYKKT